MRLDPLTFDSVSRQAVSASGTPVGLPQILHPTHAQVSWWWAISHVGLRPKETDEQLFVETLGLTDKASYLVFRTSLKALLRAFEAEQKRLRATMVSKDPALKEWDASLAQSRRASNATLVTGLIALRRRAKVWSAKARAQVISEAA